MKLAQLYLFAICILMISSCKKDSPADAEVKNDGLVGKWKLVEALHDPGDGSGKFVKVEDFASSTVEFRKDGSFKEVKGPIYSSINPYNRYTILDPKRVQLELVGGNYSFDPLIWYIDELTPTSLTLGFGCDEPCLGKFVPIK